MPYEYGADGPKHLRMFPICASAWLVRGPKVAKRWASLFVSICGPQQYWANNFNTVLGKDVLFPSIWGSL